MKAAACTQYARHKWQWVADVTLKSVKVNSNGTMVKLSRRGKYECICGARRHGAARGGL